MKSFAEVQQSGRDMILEDRKAFHNVQAPVVNTSFDCPLYHPEQNFVKNSTILLE